MANSLAAVQTWLTAHRTPVLVTVFGGAAILGLKARSKAQSATGSTGAGNTGAAAGDTTYSGAGGAYYDSTANDVYNAIEPQISALASQLDTLSQTPTVTDPVTTPPAPTPTIGATAGHVPTGTVWGVTGSGHAGMPAPTTVTTTSTHTSGSWGTTGPKA